MPYDPSFPQENTPIDAAPMRNQFNSLKALIDALPTQADLANVLQSTSNYSNGVGFLSMSAEINYDQNQLQTVINKLDELILALRR